jgi:hypothetical protein
VATKAFEEEQTAECDNTMVNAVQGIFNDLNNEELKRQ